MNAPIDTHRPLQFRDDLDESGAWPEKPELSSPTLSIVIPVHDEEANIIPLLGEIHQQLKWKYRYEVVVVDDNSSDGTASALEVLAGQDPALKIIMLSRRCGQSSAVLQGVRAAMNPVIVTLDGDGQNVPDDIDRLVQRYRQVCRQSPRCLVIGNRHQRRDSGWRRFTSRVANGIRSRVLGDGTPDSGCGLKVISREFFLELPAFNHMHRFLPALVHQHGGEVFSVDIQHRSRQNGTSHYGSLDRLAEGIIDLLGVVWLGRRTMKPEMRKGRRSA